MICKCGVCYTPDGWEALRPVGVMDDGEGGWLEMRNCKCGSTISRDLGKNKRAMQRVLDLHVAHHMMPPGMPEAFRSTLAKGMLKAFPKVSRET